MEGSAASPGGVARPGCSAAGGTSALAGARGVAKNDTTVAMQNGSVKEGRPMCPTDRRNTAKNNMLAAAAG